MNLKVKSIKFNHDPNSMSSDALTIRKNKTQTVNVPEWQDGSSMLPEDSPAAYAMKETAGNTLTIQARFISDDSITDSVEVRAIDAVINPERKDGCIGWLIYLLRAILIALFGNALGEVNKKWINLVNGDSGFVTLNLINTKIWNVGVSARTTEWQWQYRYKRRGRWQNMQVTKHKIYIILEAPKSAWNQTSGSDQLPWTDVLDYACIWAFGAQDRDSASAKITERVNALGPSVIEYDCPGYGSSQYSWGSFDCSKFIERLKGGIGNGKYVNCSDCATIVSTFTNILGCDLWQSRMGVTNNFKLNPMLGIGSSVWQPACGWYSFSYHEVAWKNNCDVNDNIFDACLKVDGDSDPTSSPHTPLLPINMKFGDCSTLDYRLRLSPATSDGCGNCAPHTSSRTRRSII